MRAFALALCALLGLAAYGPDLATPAPKKCPCTHCQDCACKDARDCTVVSAVTRAAWGGSSCDLVQVVPAPLPAPAIEQFPARPRRPHPGNIRAGSNALDGEEVTCDLPASEHLKNTGGSDGAGLCVFCSLDHDARWAGEKSLIGFRDFMTHYPGGGWPDKVDQMIPRMAASKGLPTPPYAQHTGGDPEFLKLALKTGRYVAVTYAGSDGVFYNGPIDHMVNLVHLSDKWAVIHDNNYPGQWLWMPPSEFLSRWKARGGGWAVVLLKPGPPPVPGGSRPKAQERDALELAARNLGPSPAVTPKAQELPAGEFVWRGPDQGHYYLWNRDLTVQVGTLHPDLRGYKPIVGNAFSEGPEVPPVAPPEGVPLNFGLDRTKIPTVPGYRVNGKECSREEAFRAVGAGTLVDDSALYRLTVNFADATVTKKVLADLESDPALAPFKGKLLVQAYSPEEWAVAGVGFAEGVTLQPPPGPSGKSLPLWRFRSYPGPKLLAAALRKPSPDYDPAKDPDPTQPKDDPKKPSPAPSPDLISDEINIPKALGKLPAWAYAFAALAGLVLWTNKKKDK